MSGLGDRPAAEVVRVRRYTGEPLAEAPELTPKLAQALLVVVAKARARTVQPPAEQIGLSSKAS